MTRSFDDVAQLAAFLDASPVPRGAIGTVIVVEWCDLDGRTVALLTMKRGNLLLSTIAFSSSLPAAYR